MNADIGPIARFLKTRRRETSLTQRQLAEKAGVGLRFVRDVEQGKRSVRLDRVNAVLSLFGCCVGPIRMEEYSGDTENR